MILELKNLDYISSEGNISSVCNTHNKSSSFGGVQKGQFSLRQVKTPH